jgi:2-(1,2-epoxy-1,2-dihydrophenyl)acetyl-CoA isomerase
MAEALAAAPVRALGASRALLMDSGNSAFETHLEREARSIVAAGADGESREGIAAYLQKRKPDFIGA